MVKPMTERMSVVGVFHSATEAQAAVRDLKAAGFRDDEIGILGPGDHGSGGAHGGHSVDGGTHAAEGAAAGVATGAGIGALWAVGIAAGLLPAIGPVIAGGIFASILASAAGGAAVAGLAGALVGLGIPEEEASYYENEFRSGRTVVTVKTTTRQDEARRILGRHSGYDMESRPDRAGTRSTSTTASTAGLGATGRTAGLGTSEHLTSASRSTAPVTGGVGTQRVELREEELHAEKVQRSAGEVRAHKEVITEHKTIDVPVTREEVVIERHAAGGRATSGPIVGDQEIRIPVKEEEVRVTKTPVVKEEVSIGKRQVVENRHVEADVKHEELRIDETGDAHVKGPNTPGRGSRKSR